MATGSTRLIPNKLPQREREIFDPALLLLRVAVIQQRPFLLENIEDESFNWRFSQRRGFIQVADDFPAQLAMSAWPVPNDICN